MANTNEGTDKVVKKVNVFSVLAGAGLVTYCSDGSVDFEATLSAVQDRVTAEAAETAEWDARISAALNSVFDGLKAGQRIPRPLAVNIAVQKLGCTEIADMQDATLRVDDYLDRTNAFSGKRGRNGGLGRE